MGKLDEVMKSAANMRESMGVGAVAETAAPPAMPERLRGVTKSRHALDIPVGKIEGDPNQPREEFDPESLERLAASLKAKGQLQPVRVRWDEGRGVYLIVCGERRWRAARMAGMATIAATVMEGEASAEDLLELQLVENCVREDLRPVEQARGIRLLMDRKGLSVRGAAEILSMSHATVVRVLALLDLPPSVQSEVEAGAINPSTAYEIAKAETPERREELGRLAVAGNLTGAQVREARERKPTRKETWKGKAGIVITATVPEGVGDEDLAAALKEVMNAVKRRRPAEAA